MASYRIHMGASTRAHAGGVNNRINVDDPVWSHVEQWLREAYRVGGSVAFELEKEIVTGGVGHCSLRADPGRFLLMASIYGIKRDKAISWQEPEGTPDRGKTALAGDLWDARWVQTDIEIALRIFREVFDTGELSEESLRHMR